MRKIVKKVRVADKKDLLVKENDPIIVAEVRDYEVEKCIENNTGMKIVFNNQEMTLSVNQLENEKRAMSAKQVSKYGTTDYKLVGYLWNPDNV